VGQVDSKPVVVVAHSDIPVLGNYMVPVNNWLQLLQPTMSASKIVTKHICYRS